MDIFGIFFVFERLRQHNYSEKIIIASLALGNGIGYVWIVRVFLLTALAMPFLENIYQVMSKKRYLVSLGIIYLIYELIYFKYPGVNIFYELIPYSCVAGWGILAKDLNKKQLFISAIWFGSIFLIMFFDRHLIGTQIDKYPPRLYYLSYSLAISLLLYAFSLTKMFKTIFDNRWVKFVGMASFEIYLWQILFLSVVKFNSWEINYLVVLSLSVLAAFGCKVASDILIK